MPKNQG